jgi:hypothetical protein
VYENARVDEDESFAGLGTGLGAVVDVDGEGRFQDLEIDDWRGDSESEALSQASSSPQSATGAPNLLGG